MITAEMLEDAAERCRRMPPNDWMVSIGLTADAEQRLRETATLASRMGKSIEDVGMSRFQLGFELAVVLQKQDKLGGIILG